MKNIMVSGVLCAGLLISGSAAATTWIFSGDSASSGAAGNTRSTSADAVTVTAKAYSSANNGADALQAAYLGVYGGSLGVTNSGESGSSPGHAVDNAGSVDTILLEFDKAVSLTYLYNAWYNHGYDTDVSVAAFTGASFSGVEGKTFSTLVSNGWTSIANVADVQAWSTPFNGGQVYSSYWLVGAYNPMMTNSGWSFGNDYVKLSAFHGSVCTGTASGGVCGQESNGVPEPGSLALAGLGLLGVMGMRRYRK